MGQDWLHWFNEIGQGRILQAAASLSHLSQLGESFLLTHRNVIHGSDSVESAQQEISLWFRPEELPCWEDTAAPWIYE